MAQISLRGELPPVLKGLEEDLGLTPKRAAISKAYESPSNMGASAKSRRTSSFTDALGSIPASRILEEIHGKEPQTNIGTLSNRDDHRAHEDHSHQSSSQELGGSDAEERTSPVSQELGRSDRFWQSVTDLENEKIAIEKYEKSLRKVHFAQTWKQTRAKKQKKSLCRLGIIEPEQVRSAVVADGEWEEIELAVDSGASETVAHEGVLQSVETTDGDAKKKGVQYEVADGTLIPNLGEKSFIAVDEGGALRRMKVQVCDVNKPLLSVRRVTQAGNRVVFEKDGGWIEDTSSGEKLWLKEKDGMYLLKLWVQKGGKSPAGFSWQGQ
ncbi:hypothetical protein N9L68_00970 [bacterium]|nr:hypothetical protein [bacterium]